jgi:hypothetical protein
MKQTFFFGGTSRPVMIRVAEGFTYFAARFCDCVGFEIGSSDESLWQGLTLRTPQELHQLADWIRGLEVPSLPSGEPLPVSVKFPGFSPQYADESISADEDFEGHDATELRLNGVWSHLHEDEPLCLHLGAQEPDGLDVPGIPALHLPRFAELLDLFASEWELNGIDLTADQPLAHLDSR